MESSRTNSGSLIARDSVIYGKDILAEYSREYAVQVEKHKDQITSEYNTLKSKHDQERSQLLERIRVAKLGRGACSPAASETYRELLRAHLQQRRRHLATTHDMLMRHHESLGKVERDGVLQSKERSARHVTEFNELEMEAWKSFCRSVHDLLETKVSGFTTKSKCKKIRSLMKTVREQLAAHLDATLRLYADSGFLAPDDDMVTRWKSSQFSECINKRLDDVEKQKASEMTKSWPQEIQCIRDLLDNGTRLLADVQRYRLDSLETKCADELRKVDGAIAMRKEKIAAKIAREKEALTRSVDKFKRLCGGGGENGGSAATVARSQKQSSGFGSDSAASAMACNGGGARRLSQPRSTGFPAAATTVVAFGRGGSSASARRRTAPNFNMSNAHSTVGQSVDEHGRLFPNRPSSDDVEAGSRDAKAAASNVNENAATKSKSETARSGTVAGDGAKSTYGGDPSEGEADENEEDDDDDEEGDEDEDDDDGDEDEEGDDGDEDGDEDDAGGEGDADYEEDGGAKATPVKNTPAVAKSKSKAKTTASKPAAGRVASTKMKKSKSSAAAATRRRSRLSKVSRSSKPSRTRSRSSSKARSPQPRARTSAAAATSAAPAPSPKAAAAAAATVAAPAAPLPKPAAGAGVATRAVTYRPFIENPHAERHLLSKMCHACYGGCVCCRASNGSCVGRCAVCLCPCLASWMEERKRKREEQHGGSGILARLRTAPRSSALINRNQHRLCM